MVSLKVTVDTKALLTALSTLDNKKLVQKHCRVALGEAATLVQHTARKEHKFKTRSGMAEHSIARRVYVSTKKVLAKVFLDTGIAKYGPYLHEGTRDHTVSARGGGKNRLMWLNHSGIPGARGTVTEQMFAKSVKVKGIKRDRFIVNALIKNRQKVEAMVMRGINAALREAKLK